MKIKLKKIDQVFLAIFAVLGLISLIVLSLSLGIHSVGQGIANLAWNSRLVNVLGWIVFLGLIAWITRLVVMRLKGGPGVFSESTQVQDTEQGSVRVSVRAMETLVRRAVAQTDGILDSNIRINNTETDIAVEIDMVVGIETHVPAVTALLQRNVKGIVEEFAGIAVRDVVVLVTEIRDNAPAALPAPADETAAVVVVPEQVEHVAEESAAEAEEPVAEAEEPVEEPAAEAEEPVEEPAAEVEEPVEEPAAEAEEPVEEPAAEVEEPVEEPAAEAEEPVEEPAAETEESEEAEEQPASGAVQA